MWGQAPHFSIAFAQRRPRKPIKTTVAQVVSVYVTPCTCTIHKCVCGLQADIQALSIFKHHRGVVEDVAWHHTSPNTFGSVGDDKLALLWDKRHSGGIPPPAPSRPA